jgi:uncharacterized protein YcfJ
MKSIRGIAVPIIAAVALTGCASPQYQARRSEINSAVVGGLAGAAAGGVIGNNVGDNQNVALGAAIGTLAGAWMGQQYGRTQDNYRNRLDALETQSQIETMMIPNSNGSYTPVTLNKVGYGQYRGPRGEIYTSMPSAEQLKQAYAF